jgi:hypothetical protein
MKLKIPCFCDNSFSVEVPDEIDLDTEPHYIEAIVAGNFMNFVCTSCGKKHKPEFPLVIRWGEKKLNLEVLPELERGNFYLRKKDTAKDASVTETVIGFPELAERITVIRDDLVPEVIETLKYYLLLKADESYPDQEISVWYQNKNGNNLVFHIHGIKQDEVAIMNVPFDMYEKTLADFKKNPRGEPFASLRVKTYFSVQNPLRPDELK